MRFFETLIGDEILHFSLPTKYIGKQILGTIYPSIIQELLGIFLTRKVKEIFRPNTSSIINLLLTRTEFDDSSKKFVFQPKMFLFVSFNGKRNKIYLRTCSDNLSHLCIQSHLLFSMWRLTYCKCKTVSTLFCSIWNPKVSSLTPNGKSEK